MEELIITSLFTVDPGSGAYFSTISTAMCTSIYFTKISLQGQVIWSSYYGGTVTDYSAGLCSDNFGNVYFSGYSTSNNFQPIQQVGGYYQKNAIPNSSTVSSFIVAFDSNNQTKWATYFGGTYDDAIYTNTCDKIKNKLYVLGNANSKIDFPLNDGGGIPYFQGTIPSLVSSAFVTRFNISSNFSGIIDLDNSINQVDIFPNPAENYVYLSINELISNNNELTVYNNMGNEVLRLNNINTKQAISISNLNEGIYIVKLANGNNAYTTKLSITK